MPTDVNVNVDANQAFEQMKTVLNSWGGRHSYYKDGYKNCTTKTVEAWYAQGYNCCVIWDGCCDIVNNSKYAIIYDKKCARPGDPTCFFGFTTYKVVVMPPGLKKSEAGCVTITTSRRGHENWAWDGPNITSSNGGNCIRFY